MLRWVLILLSIGAVSCTGRKLGERCSATTDCSRTLSCCGGVCVDTSKDIENCGACTSTCSTNNAAAICDDGSCTVACNPGFGDCNSSAADGCEIDLTSTAAHCGTCATPCSFSHASATCTASRCALGTCSAGFQNCDAINANGCEVDTTSSADNCSACGAKCMVSNAAPACIASTCGVSSCAMGYGDCDGLPGNGCEAAFSSNALHCGRCGAACAAGAECVSGFCQVRELLVFGGLDAEGSRAPSADVYRFSLFTKEYSKLVTQGTVLHPGTSFHSAAWDHIGNRMLVFGGGNPQRQPRTVVQNDTWQLSFATEPPTWSQVIASGSPPTARVGAASVYDQANRKWYLFGGADLGLTPYQDFHVYDAVTDTWTDLVTPTMPPGRYFAALTIDPTTGRVVLHGGTVNGAAALDDLWTYDPAATNPGWVQISAATPPSVRLGHVLFSDLAPVAMFGGTDAYTVTGPVGLPTDVMTLTLGSSPAWSTLSIAATPAGRVFSSVATLAGTRYLFGGGSTTGAIIGLDDLWSLDVATSTWTTLRVSKAPNGPGVNVGAALVARE